MIELSCERLVVRENERRAIHLLDDLGHRERLTRAGDAEEHLVLVPPGYAFGELGDRLRLVAARLIVARKFEVHDSDSQPKMQASGKTSIITRHASRSRMAVYCVDSPALGRSAI